MPATVPDSVTLTNLDVAERQLCQAIRLFFSRADEVSAHTLTCSASQVLRDLAAQRRTGSPVREAVRTYIRPDKQDEFLRILNKAWNFSKHADRDPESTLVFYPGLTPHLILEAVEVHRTLSLDTLPELLVFGIWFNLRHPDVLLPGPLKDLFTGELVEGIDPEDFGMQLLSIATTRRMFGERFTLPVQPRRAS
jgi:hypothetical protein